MASYEMGLGGDYPLMVLALGKGEKNQSPLQLLSGNEVAK